MGRHPESLDVTINRVAVALPFVATLLGASSTAAQEKPRLWELDAGVSGIIMGPKGCQTGGVMPRVSLKRRWRLSPTWDVSMGAQTGVFGFGAGPRGLGFLAGPSVGLSARPLPWLGLSLSIETDGGRIPVCYPWGLLIRHVGFFPAWKASMTWYSNSLLAFGVDGGVRVINTLAWVGAAFQGGAYLRAAF